MGADQTPSGSSIPFWILMGTASILGVLLVIPIGTVMSRLYSARRSLAEKLEDVL